MVRNEYRRALIMLRAVEQGYTGHVRLERRTLMGTMSFVITAPSNGANLVAALVGKCRENYFAAKLGELRRDSRGQATLQTSFDPRNIAGHELEEYQLVVVMAIAEGKCDLVLTGNVSGSAQVDWGSVRRAACALGTNQGNASTDQCEGIIQPRTEVAGEGALLQEASGADAQSVPEAEVSAWDLPAEEYAAEGSGSEAAQPQAAPEPEVSAWDLPAEEYAAEGSGSEAAQLQAAPEAEVSAWDLPAEEYAAEGSGSEAAQSQAAPEAEVSAWDLPAEEYAAEEQGASGRIGVDGAAEESTAWWDLPAVEAPSNSSNGTVGASENAEQSASEPNLEIPWPEPFADLRELFRRGERVEEEIVQGYSFVRAAMPEKSGYAYVAIGLRCEDGRPTSVCYALPAPYSPEPPAGLADYEWVGQGNAGWWVKCINAE